jgi:hypothetical protein
MCSFAVPRKDDVDSRHVACYYQDNVIFIDIIFTRIMYTYYSLLYKANSSYVPAGIFNPTYVKF